MIKVTLELFYKILPQEIFCYTTNNNWKVNVMTIKIDQNSGFTITFNLISICCLNLFFIGFSPGLNLCCILLYVLVVMKVFFAPVSIFHTVACPQTLPDIFIPCFNLTLILVPSQHSSKGRLSHDFATFPQPIGLVDCSLKNCHQNDRHLIPSCFV